MNSVCNWHLRECHGAMFERADVSVPGGLVLPVLSMKVWNNEGDRMVPHPLAWPGPSGRSNNANVHCLAKYKSHHFD